MKKLILSVVVTAFAISVYAGGSECSKQAAAGSCSSKTPAVAEAKGDCASACTKTQASAVKGECAKTQAAAKTDCASECSKTKASAKTDCATECSKTKASAKTDCATECSKTKASAAKSGCCKAGKTATRIQSPKAAA